MADSGLIPDTQGNRVSSSRPFWQYWTASTISNAGTAVTSVALPLLAVRVLNATAMQVSLLAAATYAAWVVIGLPAGAIVERFPMRKTQVAMDLIRALALAAIPILWWLGGLRIWQLVLIALVISTATVIFDVGNATFLPAVVSKDQLDSRNSLTSASAAATQLGGPSLSGVIIVTFGAVAALAVDAVSYLCSAFLLNRLPESGARTSTARPPVLRQIKEGWLEVTSHAQMRSCMQAATAVNFAAGGLMAVAPVFLIRTLHAPVPLVGALLAAEGVGSLVGAAVTPRVSARWGSARSVLGGCGLATVAMAVLACAGAGPFMVLFALGGAGFGAGVVVLSILARTHRQVVVEQHLLSQVMATVRFVSWGAIPVGAITGGYLASKYGTRTALGSLALAAAAAPIVLVWGGCGLSRDLGSDRRPDRGRQISLGRLLPARSATGAFPDECIESARKQTPAVTIGLRSMWFGRYRIETASSYRDLVWMRGRPNASAVQPEEPGLETKQEELA